MKTIDSFFGEYRFLSNFYLCPPGLISLPDDNMSYRSVEHAYQASKHIVGARSVFRGHISPSTARALGGNATTEWHEKKLDLMHLLLEQKFSDHLFKILLLRTDDATLIEGNTWHDNFWGACLCENCINFAKLNHLGTLLELVRCKLRQISAFEPSLREKR